MLWIDYVWTILLLYTVSAGDADICVAQLRWTTYDGLLTWPAAGVRWMLGWDRPVECLTSQPRAFSMQPELLTAWHLESERQEAETAQKSRDISFGAF